MQLPKTLFAYKGTPTVWLETTLHLVAVALAFVAFYLFFVDLVPMLVGV